MTSEHAPLIPPDPGSPVRTSAGGPDDGARLLEGSERIIQRKRGWCYLMAGVATLLTGIFGRGTFHLRGSLAVIAIGYLSTVLFSLFGKRARRANRRINLEPWWIYCDVVIITAIICLTGGVESQAYIWYLACAGAAAYHCSFRFALVGAVATALLYFGALVGMGQIGGLDHAFITASTHLIFLFGSSLFLLLNTRKLRDSGLLSKRLKKEAVARVDELTRVTRDLEAMSRLLASFTEADPVTGLPSRRYFMDRIAEDADRLGNERRAARQAGIDAGIIMVDVDDLKIVNDTHGRSAGDAVLKHLAKVLRRCLRDDDRLVRWGGDEFLILLPQVHLEKIPEVAERIVQAVRAQPCRLAGGDFQPLTCSVGWSDFDWRPRPDGAQPWDRALEAAAAALETAKAGGRRLLPFEPTGPHAELNYFERAERAEGSEGLVSELAPAEPAASAA